VRRHAEKLRHVGGQELANQAARDRVKGPRHVALHHGEQRRHHLAAFRTLGDLPALD
jgi:hypothetical protein